MKSLQRTHYPQGFRRVILAMIFAESRTEKLKQLRIPTLIIHGNYDPVFTVEHGQQLANVLPNTHLEIIEKMGHGLPDCLCEKLVDLCSHFYFKLSR